MLSVVMICVIILNVVMLNFVMLSVIMLNATMLSVIIMNLIMLSLIILSVIMLSTVAIICRSAKCFSTKWHGTKKSFMTLTPAVSSFFSSSSILSDNFLRFQDIRKLGILGDYPICARLGSLPQKVFL